MQPICLPAVSTREHLVWHKEDQAYQLANKRTSRCSWDRRATPHCRIGRGWLRGDWTGRIVQSGIQSSFTGGGEKQDSVTNKPCAVLALPNLCKRAGAVSARHAYVVSSRPLDSPKDASIRGRSLGLACYEAAWKSAWGRQVRMSADVGSKWYFQVSSELNRSLLSLPAAAAAPPFLYPSPFSFQGVIKWSRWSFPK